ncbi:electron transfer flavoprotein subunit alpha/FixB family protein [Chelatococcus sambhunathii]|uniref:Electron transfer flavoprotein subunit alpha/FixB family protein n=1 Tax=Chelatococcus sambhunathii TaxID=363953 RepID=A0ABU1DG69_9HYPH|nr:electron transfer flavoprotein subunit alpha/FixB family protein [Chelatococcus sambhunathii]MDR4307096.1 electron transfer flavoprotein subunit alpha/FixB family protein [Chelatococcus sambhunathii]
MTRLRRDPRTERAAARTSGAERPRYDLALKAAPSRRPRRDPRAEAAAQRVPAAARLRLDRSQFGAATVVATHVPERQTDKASPKPIIVENPDFLVLVVPDMAGGRLGEHDRQLFGAARELAGKTGATLALVGASSADLGPAGADRVAVVARDPDAYDPDARAAEVVAAMRALDPKHVLFPESADGGDLARRVSVLTGEPLFTEAEQVSASALGRPARCRKVEQRSVPTRLISVAADSVASYSGAPREARNEQVDLASGPAKTAGAIVSATRIPADPATVPLALADFVVSAGNGVTDLDMFRQVVAALGATPGASRVLCDAGLMPRAAQVGASGTVLGASCYFALGIAGAPQHLQGVADCEHIVAVNTDLHAAMIARAGLGIIQDAQLVMPAILEELERERRETGT